MEHPNTACFTTFRQDYVAITENNKCAAMMLSLLEGFSKTCSWVNLSANDISYYLVGLFPRKTILQAGKLLTQLGLVARQQEDETDRSYRYLVQKEVLNFRIQLAAVWDASFRFVFWRRKRRKCKIKSSLWWEYTTKWLAGLWESLALEPSQEAKVPPEPLQESSVICASSPAETRSITSSINLNKTTKPVVVTKNIETASPLANEIELPYSQRLYENGVNLQDEGLQKAAKKNLKTLDLSIWAWLEWAKVKRVEQPTKSLVGAINQHWKPNGEVPQRVVESPVVEQAVEVTDRVAVSEKIISQEDIDKAKDAARKKLEAKAAERIARQREQKDIQEAVASSIAPRGDTSSAGMYEEIFKTLDNKKVIVSEDLRNLILSNNPYFVKEKILYSELYKENPATYLWDNLKH